LIIINSALHKNEKVENVKHFLLRVYGWMLEEKMKKYKKEKYWSFTERNNIKIDVEKHGCFSCEFIHGWII